MNKTTNAKHKHTPGPWHVGAGNGQGSIFADERPDGRSVRMRLEERGTTLYPIASVNYGWDEQEDEANARLIAAAPDLLEACQSLVAMYEYLRIKGALREPPYDADCPYEPTTEGMQISKARAVIAKAEGQNTGGNGNV